MICVCTTCVHLASAQKARKTPPLSDFNQVHRHDIKLKPQGQQRPVLEPTQTAAKHLEYGNHIKAQLGNNKRNDEINQLHRNKRHAGHSHEVTAAAAGHSINHIEVNPNVAHFIEKLFEQFSNGDSKTMNLIEFENLMKHLGLDRLIDNKQLNNLIHTSDESSSSNNGVGSIHDDNYESSLPDTHSNDTVSTIQRQNINIFFPNMNKYRNIRKRHIRMSD